MLHFPHNARRMEGVQNRVRVTEEETPPTQISKALHNAHKPALHTPPQPSSTRHNPHQHCSVHTRSPCCLLVASYWMSWRVVEGCEWLW